MEEEKGSPGKRVRSRKKLMYNSIRKQMEFYFSDANITKDRFLGQLVMEDPCKYSPNCAFCGLTSEYFLCFSRCST